MMRVLLVKDWIRPRPINWARLVSLSVPKMQVTDARRSLWCGALDILEMLEVACALKALFAPSTDRAEGQCDTCSYTLDGD